MHNAAFAALGMDEEWSYEAIEVAPDAFEERVRAMPGEGFAGANVTVPHKGAALSVADELSETAREIGAANTLVFEDGEVRAHNTDADGLLGALPASPAGKRALVLGAGGAARAVVWALVREGAEVDVWNRTELRSQNLCEELGGRPVPDPDQAAYELIVNTTAVGLQRRGPVRGAAACRRRASSPGQIVVDMVYGDEPSRLAGRRGGRRRDDRRRDRGSRPAGRPLLPHLDGTRRAARCDARGRPRTRWSVFGPIGLKTPQSAHL